mmetsp:Transcript_55061/g.99156  ORF Transcript_55061/g.99156 Transcript_55061/m.99156 type:complete len:286 (-) Transcript_55061:123-980(-)
MAAEGFRLFVGSLPQDITREELELVFKTYGEVSDIHVIAGDRAKSATGQSCAFIIYARRESCEDAIKVLDNVYKIREAEQNPIKVSWARASGGGGGKGFGKNDGMGMMGKGDWGKGGKGNWGGCGGCGGGCGGCDGGWNSWGGQGGGMDSWGGGKGSWQGNAWDGKGKGYDGGQWGGKGKSGGGGNSSGTRLFVGNLPPEITTEALDYVAPNRGARAEDADMRGLQKLRQRRQDAHHGRKVKEWPELCLHRVQRRQRGRNSHAYSPREVRDQTRCRAHLGKAGEQ